MRNIEKYQYNTVADAVRYLMSHGWQISAKSVYRHVKEGKIGQRPWEQEELDRYAAEFLRPAVSDRPAGQKAVKGAARELLEARREKMRVEIDLKNFELRQKQDAYIELIEHSRLMAAKLYLIRDTCENWIREHVNELIIICHGDLRFSYEVVELYQDSFQKYWNRLDTDGEFPVFTESDFQDEILE